MSEQMREELQWEGKRFLIDQEPLESFFQLQGGRPELEPAGSCLWRGYLGEWEIVQEKLYLSRLGGALDGDPVSLATVFPGAPERVFAFWFSGLLSSSLRQISEPEETADSYRCEQVLEFKDGLLVRHYRREYGHSATLRLRGRERLIRAQPVLSQLIPDAGTLIREGFQIEFSALLRARIGRWELHDDRLYLAGVKGTLPDGAEASIASFFEDRHGKVDNPVFARWFSGDIRVSSSLVIDYRWLRSLCPEERELQLQLSQGVLQNIDVL